MISHDNIYLDTHAVVWLYTKELHKFSNKVLQILQHNYLLISPMVKLELQYLYDKKRVNVPPDQVINSLKQVLHLNICQKNWLDIVNVALTCDFTRDAFDRLIVAHAMLDNSILISKDENLIEHYKHCVW